MKATAEREIIYTPPEVSTLVLEAIDERRKNPGAGLRLGIANVDTKLLPLRPGELVTVLGRPSNYKSGLMEFWARRLAEELMRRDVAKRMVVYITYEMALEELALYDLAATARLDAAEISQGRISDAQWGELESAAMERSAHPLWIIGHSLARRRRRPALTLSNIAKALAWVEDNMDMQPLAIFVDYLQLIQAEGGEDRRMQMNENVYRCKDMALAMGCPVILGVQARREVDTRKWKLPQIGDGQETSAIEQASDKMLSIWMPKTTEQAGEELTRYNGNPVTVSDSLLMLALIKQKLGPAGMWWPLYVDATRNHIGELALLP